MARIYVHQGAIDDHDKLQAQDAQAAATIWSLIQEAKSQPKILELFTVHGFGKSFTERFHVSKWVEQQNKGRNLWRLKIWELESIGIQYRIVYAFNSLTESYYILGVVHRDFAYDETHPDSRRMLDAYDRIGIPTFSGGK